MIRLLIASAAAQSLGATDAIRQYSDLIRSQAVVAPLESGLLGESVDYYTGQTDFVATDVRLPGNFALPMAISRRYHVGNRAGGAPSGAFGDWDLDLPRVEGVIATSVGWSGTGSSGDKRCSYFGPPPAASITDTLSGGGTVTTRVPSSEYGYGFQIVVPGQGRHELLLSSSSNVSLDPIITHDWWKVSCVPQYGVQPGDPAEAFQATAPDGVTYAFVQYSSRPYPSYQRPADTAQTGVTAVVARQQAFFYPSRITDRFGNWVSYHYLSVNGQLFPDTITSSDGRTLRINYSNGMVSSISDGTRTWSYGYTSGRLTRVTLPDGSYWSIDFANLDTAGWSYGNPTCASVPTPTYSGGIGSNGSVFGTLQHPTGALGTFTFTVTRHGRNGTPSTCLTNSAGTAFAAAQPGVYDVLSLTRKVITGPRLNPLTWTIAYGGCSSSSCSATKTTRVTDARGYDTLYTFGAVYSSNADLDTEGQLQSVQSGGQNGSGYLRTDRYTYFSASGNAYPSVMGTPVQVRGDVAPLSTLRPVSQRTITVDGATYTQTLSNPDSYGFPTTITRTGSRTKTDTLTYYHNTSTWVLGTVQRLNSDGLSEFGLTLNSYSMPTEVYRFQRLDKTITYNGDGTVASVTDGDNNTTRYSNYYRGIPQSIQYANGDSESVAVNNVGAVTSWTSAAGYTTTYDHDAMGRLSGIHPPAYSSTTITWNTGASGWTRTEVRGQYTRTDTYDALLRSVRTDEPGSRTVTRTFDADGRNTFTSYPGSGSGMTSAYDALGRLRSQTDGAGYAMIFTPGANSLSVEDRNGNTTTYSYQTYDEPSTAWPTEIDAPQYTTTIARDTWGKPKSISRGNITRTLSYYPAGSNGELLHSITEPETGTTTFTYDGAANLKTVTLPDGVVQTYYYDKRNRLATVSYSNGDPDKSFTWKPDNLPESATRGNITRSWSYNSGRLLDTETVQVDSTGYSLQYGYNSDGQVSSLTYPDNTVVSLGPDAYGRPTLIDRYVTGVSYYPNGALHQFQYGNAIWHTTWQDTRQLPQESQDQGIFDWSYTYDGNANPKTITDNLGTGVNTKFFTYDTQNRLWTANASKLWGNTIFSYDKQDNLIAEQTGAVTTNYTVDSTTNRLSSFGNLNTTVSYDTRGNIQQSSFARDVTKYVYDGANQLVSMTHTVWGLSSGASYRYDANGQRTVQNISSGDGAPSKEIDIYGDDGNLYYSEYTPGYLACFGTCPPPPTKTKYYYLGKHLVAEEINDGTTVTNKYFHTDALGSPIATTDANKKVLGTTTYLPFGGRYATTGQGNQPGIGYTGQYADATGLVYMHARYYDPQIRRFLSPDPQYVDPATALNFNRYSYALNSPYAKYDPSGREAGCITDRVPCLRTTPATPQEVAATLGVVSLLFGGEALYAGYVLEDAAAAVTYGQIATSMNVAGAVISQNPTDVGGVIMDHEIRVLLSAGLADTLLGGLVEVGNYVYQVAQSGGLFDREEPASNPAILAPLNSDVPNLGVNQYSLQSTPFGPQSDVSQSDSAFYSVPNYDFSDADGGN